MQKLLNKLSMRAVFFIKSFLKYFLLLMLPLSIIVSYSLYCSNKETSETIEIRNWNLIYQIKTQIDTLFHTVNTLGNLLSDDPTINKAIRQVYLNNDITIYNNDQTKILSSYLKGIVGSNEYSHSAYLYFDNDFNRFIATANGLSYVYNSIDNDWMKEYQNSSEDFWCKSFKISDYSSTPTKEILAVYKKLYSPYLTANRGVLVTYYSIDTIRNYIYNLDLYPGQIILFLQDNGTILFQSSKENFSDIWTYFSDATQNASPSSIINSSIADTTYSNFKISYHGTKYVASLISSSEEDYYYLSLVPTKNLYAQSHSIIFAFCILSAVCIIIGIILGMLTAGHDYNQLQAIIEIFSNADSHTSRPEKSKRTRVTDPYQVILNNIINLFIEQNYLQMQVENKQYQMQLLELRSLQQQINPHFLFNTLNAIYWEAIKFTNKPNTCSKMIFDLTEIMSYSLHNLQETVSITKELEYLRHYTNIQTIRYQNKFEIIWDIDDETKNYVIIKMILQPLVENSINHGIKSKDGFSTIKVKVYYRQNRLLISILDNGNGMPKEKVAELRQRLQLNNEPLEHIGLVNTNRRLLLMYGPQSALRIFSRSNIGTIVSFQIPAEELEDNTK